MSAAPARAAADRAIALLAATLSVEGAARPVRAVEALAALVANRARLARTDAAGRLRYAPALPPRGEVGWPALVAAACRAPFLFESWRAPGGRAALAAAAGRQDDQMAACRRIAARALAEALPDPTGGATHWHAADCLPSWAVGRPPTAEIAGMVFYRLC